MTLHRAWLPIVFVIAFANPARAADDVAAKIDAAKQTGNIAWMLISTGLVFLMLPGLALFYGGMVRRKNILGTMMQTMVALAVVGIQWVICGYALSFGDSRGGWIGWTPELFGLQESVAGKTFIGTDCPVYVHAMFQGMFAIITAAIISGAFAERVRFGPYCLFILLWTTLVYDPLAHWVWALKATAADPMKAEAAGWLGQIGALDFAGGTVVHIAAGVSGLVAVLALPRRRGYPEQAFHPNSMVLTLLGAGLLWFGWFGFNGGSAIAANVQAGSALTVTQIAAAAAALAWVLIEWAHRGKPTALGLASGLVAGLVGITPASGFVSPMSAIIIGAVAAGGCYLAVTLKPKLKYDDTLDAFGIHGIGGILGAVLTGVFVSAALWRTGIGVGDDAFPSDALKAGRWEMIVVQLKAVGVVIAYAAVLTLVLVKVIDWTIGFQVTDEDENVGLDRAVHGEVGFDLGPAQEQLAIEPLPRAAAAPPPNGGKRRFEVVVEGVETRELMSAWSDLCQTGSTPPPREFLAVYPNVTTVQGNRFRFRGGDPVEMRQNLQKLLHDRLHGHAIETHVEN